MSKVVKEKLKISDYVFEMDGKDIGNAQITYYYDCMESIKLNNGKEVKKEYIPLISLEIAGIYNNKKASLNFMLQLDLEMLNKFSPNKIEDITKYLLDGEAFIKRPDADNNKFLNMYLPTNQIEDMFHQITRLYVSKLADNKFILKLAIPTEKTFTYFKVNFKK